MSEAFPPGADVVALLNTNRGGFEIAMGLVFTHASQQEVRCTVPVGAHLTQPYGLVHGGVYTSIVETLASVGAALVGMPRGQTTVGLENSTAFMRATRAGTLTGIGIPLHTGRTTQVWEVEVRDDEGRLVAKGRVRMQCLERGARVAGETVAIKPAAGS